MTDSMTHRVASDALTPEALGHRLSEHHALAAAVAEFKRAREAAPLLGAAAAEPSMPLCAGATLEAWALLAAVAASDVSAARVIEPHFDAVEILRQAELPVPEHATLGVFAAEHPTKRLRARESSEQFLLQGEKAWCSLAGSLSHAIVTAHLGTDHEELSGKRQAFLVDLQQPGVTAGSPDAWAALGMQDVPTVDLHFGESVVATPVGGPDWYLERSGFAWGGIGVAACWYGGLVWVWREVVSAAHRRAATQGPLDQLGFAHMGRIEASRATAAAALADAAARVDGGEAEGADGARLALVTRRIVARSLEQVMTEARAALGPSPWAHNRDFAKQMAALELYALQEHADRDAAALGRTVFETGDRR